MEKLIKLLNKAKPLKKYKEYWYIGNEIYLYTYAEDYGASKSRNITLDVISKSYGFIKWLVENGKIHREKIPAVIKVDGYLADGSDTEYYNMEESLLMLLSISDTPIEFLISILKNV